MGWFEEQVLDVLRAGCTAAPVENVSEEPKVAAHHALTIEIPTMLQMSFDDSLESSRAPEDEFFGSDEWFRRMGGAPAAETPARSLKRKHEVLGTVDSAAQLLTDLGSPVEKVSASPQPVLSSCSRKRTMLHPIPKPKQLKNWKNATPSRYCHACGSEPRNEKVACTNLEVGTCRKVFCRPCIEKIYGQWGHEHANQTWECTHCAGACPLRASCRYYSKRNSKRSPRGRNTPTPSPRG